MMEKRLYDDYSNVLCCLPYGVTEMQAVARVPQRFGVEPHGTGDVTPQA